MEVGSRLERLGKGVEREGNVQTCKDMHKAPQSSHA